MLKGGLLKPVSEFPPNRLDIGQCRQARLITQVLDFVRGGCSCKAEVLVPSHHWFCQI
jgi:hypothetical protein